MKVSAILWDYDGTLVDSTKKNMEVTVEVLKYIHGDAEYPVPEILTSVDQYLEANHRYKNWRELYKNCYDLSEEQVDAAGKLWSPYQLANQSIAELYPGLEDTIGTFRDISQGICSQNGSENIRKSLKAFHISKYFQAIVGYEEVPNLEQKPNPAGFLQCLGMLQLPIRNTTLIYIGDHQEDVAFGKNAERVLNEKGKEVVVKSIAVSYSNSSPENWKLKPDYIAASAKEITKLIKAIMNHR